MSGKITEIISAKVAWVEIKPTCCRAACLCISDVTLKCHTHRHILHPWHGVNRLWVSKTLEAYCMGVSEAYVAQLTLSFRLWRRSINAVRQTGVSPIVQGATRVVRWEVKDREGVLRLRHVIHMGSKSESMDPSARSKTKPTPGVRSEADPSSTTSRCYGSPPSEMAPA